MGYTDGGYKGDPYLSAWKDCPLGRKRTCRTVLFVLFEACTAFGDQITYSGTYIAMDNFFSCPILFMCLLFGYQCYAVGTLRANRRGAQSANNVWADCGRAGKKKGDMMFARFGNIAFTQWFDSKPVTFLSTIHIFARHFVPQKHRCDPLRRGSNSNAARPRENACL